jgi:hypothetical protein
MSISQKSVPIGVLLAGIILIGIPCYDLLAMYNAGLRFGTIMRPWVYFINLNASSKYWGIARMWWILYPCAAVLLLAGRNWFRWLISIAIVISLLDCTFNGFPTMRGMPPNWGPTMWWAHATVVVLLFLPSSTLFFATNDLPMQSTDLAPAPVTPPARQDPPHR